jgi:histamine receptor H3
MTSATTNGGIHESYTTIIYATNETIANDYTYDDFEDDVDFSTQEQVWIGITLFIHCLIIIFGNILTILVYIKDPKIRSVQNMYIFNLAITDILIGVSSVPIYAIYTILNFDWPMGRVYCKIWLMCDYWACAESSLTIILISYDRLQMVRQGVQYACSQTKTRAIVSIVCSWFVSFGFYGPAIFGYDYWRGHSILDNNECDVEFADARIYVFVTSILEFCIPFVLLITFNSMLYSNIRNRSRAIASNKKSTIPTISSKISPEHSSFTKEKKKLRKDKKAAKSLAILVVTYAICWAPYTILTIVQAFCNDCVIDEVYEPATWLLWCNSALNPVLYALTNRQFKENYKKLLCSHRCVCNDERVRPVRSVQSLTQVTSTGFK